MKNLFGIFKKDEQKTTNANNNQNQQMPQESSLKLKYTVDASGEIDQLNPLIKNFKSETTPYNTYDDFFESQKNLILTKNKEKRVFYKNELDYLFTKKVQALNKDPKLYKTDIDKMKLVGKIYTSYQTGFDINEIGRNNMAIKFNKLKIECIANINTFQSIAANNCIISGKWCYEVTLLTNGLFQIGFCQLNTPFTRHNGVGDDKTSYAYDGWRKVSWNGEKKMYGKHWESGDVIGVCIDMDKKIIEYYLNGEPLGIAFNNISKWENISYFTALSINKVE